jgi:hypothetical protein
MDIEIGAEEVQALLTRIEHDMFTGCSSMIITAGRITHAIHLETVFT